jgi:hypothetical protein
VSAGTIAGVLVHAFLGASLGPGVRASVGAGRGPSESAADGVTQEEIRAKVREILDRPEFARGESAISGFIDRFLERIQRALGDLLGIGFEAAGSVMLVLVYVLLALAVAFVVWRVIVAVRARRNTPEIALADPVTARVARVADLRARARAAQVAGDYLLALRLYFTALVVGLGEVGDLDYRDGWTNRELFERGKPAPAVSAALAPVLQDLDEKSFGGRAATESDANDMARLVDELLGRSSVGGSLVHAGGNKAHAGGARRPVPVSLQGKRKDGGR